MAKAKIKQTKRKRKHKPHKTPQARTPISVKQHKEWFLAALAQGCAPAEAAEAVDIARGTAYKWKKEDPEFEAAWLEAIETGVDRVEGMVYSIALRERSFPACKFILEHRRRDVYGDNANNQINNLNVTITLEEHTQRMVRMGLVLPMIEGDYYDEEQLAKNAPASS